MHQENVNVINAVGTLLNITVDHTSIILLSEKSYVIKKSLK